MCNLAALTRPALEAVLVATAVGDIWGVGRRINATGMFNDDAKRQVRIWLGEF